MRYFKAVAIDILRTLWVWFLVSPALQPLVQLLPEIGLVVGVPVPQWVEILLGALVAVGIVRTGERRYGRLVIASFGTLAIWFAVGTVLGVTDARAYGVPRLVLAKFLLWLGAVSLVVAIAFYTEWERFPRGRGDGDHSRSSTGSESTD